MLDIYYIKKHIIDNPELIELLLEESGFYRINRRGKNYKCGSDCDTKGNSVNVCTDTLKSGDFKKNVYGDLITLIQSKMGYDFKQTLNFICSKIGLSTKEVKMKNIKLPFGGFYKKISTHKEYSDDLETLDESILDKYEIVPNSMFYKDGIMPSTQGKYQIGYDSLSGRIIIPHRNTTGDLVGIMGRLNEYEIEEGMAKYFPIHAFSKSKVLFGYDKNYNTIQNKGIVILGESEKSVMKLDEMGLENGLALGGNSISEIQVRNIHALSPKTIILGFDEGLPLDYMYEQAKALKLKNAFIENNVGIIWDGENEIMEEGSKIAPMDLGRDKLRYLLKNRVIWI